MDIAVIGGGFSGTLLTAQLLLLPQFTGRVHWYERAGAVGRGVAYGTDCPAHVLNVAAQNMSAFPAHPGHLLDWLQARPGAAERDRDVLRDTYVPRPDYAAYLADSTRGIFAAAGPRLVRGADEVIDLAPQADGTTQVLRRHGPPTCVDKVALCVGHFAPRPQQVPGAELLRAPHYVANPWLPGALDGVAQKATVATLGAGLTMVDVILALGARGFAGKVVAVSRRGLWPRSHVTQPSPISLPAPPAAVTGSAVALARWLRDHVRRHGAHGGDWRQVVDALRPHTVAVWRALPQAARASFLRHGKAHWDAHRHRVAPHVGGQLAQWRHDGRLAHHAGRLDHVGPSKHPGKLALHWRLRHQPQLWRQDVDMLINCTGVHNDWRRTGDALPLALLGRGQVAPGPHGMGLALADDGAVLDANGNASATLYAMGPARLGRDFESVAVPELRQQAQALAAVLVTTQRGVRDDATRR